LITGKRPDHHGVVGNRFENESRSEVFGDDRDRSRDAVWWKGALPLWASAEAQGIRTAHMFFLTPGVDAKGKQPARYRQYDNELAPADEPGELLKWLDATPAEQPRFLTLYFYPTDREGHRHGPNSPELNEALREVDHAIGNLVAGLRERGLFERTNILFVADHGMAEAPSDQVVLLDEMIEPGKIRVVSEGAYAAIEPAAGTSIETVASRLVGRHRHTECWRKERLPARLRFGKHPRVASVICLADTGWTIRAAAEAADTSATGRTTRGDHGYDPSAHDMEAIFVAYGPAFRSGVELPTFDNVDVYFLLAEITGVDPEPGDGSLDTFAAALRAD
jgi:predicted AlkP superfamily pyrophosphatase or phosphodiesterase